MKKFSLLLILSLLSFGVMAQAQTAKKKPVAIEKSGPLSDEQFNERRLMRLNQLWNMFRVRNDQFFSEAQKDQYQKVMNATRVPELKNSEPLDVVSAKIKASAVALNQALKAEQKRGRFADVNATNLDYLNNTLLPKLEDRTYFQGTRAQLSEEFKKMIPTSYNPKIELHSPNGLPIPLTEAQMAAQAASAAASAASSAAAVPPAPNAPPVNAQSEPQITVAPGPGTYYTPTQNANVPYVPAAPKTLAPQTTPTSTGPKSFRIIMEPEGAQ